MIIPKSEWNICKLCGKSIDEITLIYKQPNTYKSQYFQKHLETDHGITLSEYFDTRHICPCGVCQKPLPVTTKSSNIVYKKMACGRNSGLLKWSEEAKTTRLGAGNPMFAKQPWNSGLTKHSSASLLKVSVALSNRTISSQTKQKQSESAKKRLIHDHKGHTHSDATKEKLRQNTLQMIKSGKYAHTNTAPFLRMETYLKDLEIKYEKEAIVSVWSFDFYLPELDIYIEVDGDYFHTNPKIYPNGPSTKTQKINWYRDKKKNQYCVDNKIKLLRFWESEIFGDEQCVKQKLLDASM